MAKVVLPGVSTGQNVSTINANFRKIEDALNSRVMWRDNPQNEPNAVQSDIDVNGKRFYNLPAPALPHEPMRLQEFLEYQDVFEGAVTTVTSEANRAADRAAAAQASASAANSSATLAAQRANAALTSANNSAVSATQSSQFRDETALVAANGQAQLNSIIISGSNTLNNDAALAIQRVNQVTSSSQQTINTTAANAQSNVTQTANRAERDINQTADRGVNRVSGLVTDAERAANRAEWAAENASQIALGDVLAEITDPPAPGLLLPTAELIKPLAATKVGYQSPVNTNTVARTVEQKFSETISVKDFGAIGNGVADDSDAFDRFWQYIRSTRLNFDPTTLDWVPTKLIIPPGRYRITRSLNWTFLRAWNVHIHADGALIEAEVDDRAVLDMCDNRGVHLHGLAIQAKPGWTPNSAILIGPAGTGTCGNNAFYDVKTAGAFKIAGLHNIGSETTLHVMCYFQTTTATSYGYAGDCNNLLGARSNFVTLRASGVPVSFTNNSFQACRFANYNVSGPGAIYLEAPAAWSFDKACYFLNFDNACVVIRQGINNRTTSLKLAGLFESNHGNGVKYLIRFVVDDGFFGACDGLELDAATPHSSVAIIRVETPQGNVMTSGRYAIRGASIKMEGTWQSNPTMFSGDKITFAGEIRCRPSAVLNFSRLDQFHGVVYTADASLITNAPAGAAHAYMVIDDVTLSGQGIGMGGPGGGFVHSQGGTHPALRSVSPNDNADIWLRPKGAAGRVRFGDWVNDGQGGYVEFKTNDGVARRFRPIPTT